MNPTPTKLAEDRIISYMFQQTAQRHLFPYVIFPAFSPLIIIFVFLIFTVKLFDSNSSFHASNLLNQG